MLQQIITRKERIRDFFSDSIKGFSLLWNSAKKLTLINFVLFVLQAILPIITLLVLRDFIDFVMKEKALQWNAAAPYIIKFSVLQLFNVIATQFSSYYTSLQQQLITDNISKQVLDKAIQLELEYYENPNFYDELHMAQQQSLYRPGLIISAYQGIIQSVITVVLFAAFLVTVHWGVVVLLIILSVPLAVSRLLHGYQQFLLDKSCISPHRKSVDLFQYLTTDTYAKEVRLFSFGDSFINQFLHIRQFIFSKKKDLNYKFLKQSIAIQFFEIIITTIIYCIIIGSAIAGAITIGGLVIYLQAFQRLQTAINTLFQSGINLFQNQLYLRQVQQYLLTEPFQSGLSLYPDSEEMKAGIIVKDLSFAYPQTENEVLSAVNMRFTPGKITAIVGENGSGKSTLIKLLCGLYNVKEQMIFFEGNDYSNLDKNKLRENITAIFQDFGKYYLTVRENIALGDKHVNTERMYHAADKAGIAEKVTSFPSGYDTHLGRSFKNGEQLSGGQWQKIALARGFYKDKNILILDEPTSALDPIAEYDIFTNLKEDIGNKVVILITHRLYNLKIADYIYVMEDGGVTEEGTFNDLLHAQGSFTNIYNKQAI